MAGGDDRSRASSQVQGRRGKSAGPLHHIADSLEALTEVVRAAADEAQSGHETLVPIALRRSPKWSHLRSGKQSPTAFAFGRCDQERRIGKRSQSGTRRTKALVASGAERSVDGLGSICGGQVAFWGVRNDGPSIFTV